MAKLRCCIIGCTSDWYVKIHHPSLQRLHERVQLAAAASRDPAKRDWITRTMGFDKAYGDIDEMLDKEKPDYAVICVGPTQAADMACNVLSRRIPLLMEKPVGSNPEEGRRVEKAANEAGVPNMVAFNRRHNPLLVRAKSLANERGGISHIVGEWRRYDVKSPRSMMGSGLHMVDTLRFLGGDVVRSNGDASRTRYFDNAMVASSFHLGFASGAIGTFSHNVRAGRAYEQYRIHAENWSTTVSLPPPGRYDTRWWMQIEEEDKIKEEKNMDYLSRAQRNALYTQGFWQEHEHFLVCLENGEAPRPSVAEAVRSMELAEDLLAAVVPAE